MRPAPAVWLASALLALGAADAPSSAASSSLLIDGRSGWDDIFYYYGSDAHMEDQEFDPSSTDHVILLVSGPRSPEWRLHFRAPAGEVLHTGNYDAPGGPPGDGAALDVFSHETGLCLGTSGRFGVVQIGFDATGRLEKFWAVFTQTCGSKTMSGEVRFNADVDVTVEAPDYVQGVEERPISFQVSAHDRAGQPAALFLTGEPAGATLGDAGDGTGTFSWTPGAGQAGQYWIALTGHMPGGEGDIVYTRVDVDPDFDHLEHAIAFSSLPFFHSFEAPILTPAPGDPICGEAALASGWFEYTPAEDGRVQLYLQANTGHFHYVSLYERESGGLRAVACDRWSVRADVVAGRTYDVMVGLPQPVPSFYLRVDPLPAPPPNDERDRPTVVTALPFHEEIDAGGARNEAGDPGACGNQFVHNPNVWYAYTPAEDMRVTVDIPFDQTSVFRGPNEALVLLDCETDAPVTFTALAGETYRVMTSQPTFPLSWPIFVTISGRPAFGFGVTFDQTAGVNTRTGDAVVRGEVTCARPARLHLEGELRQGSADRVGARGTFGVEVACDGRTGWTATVAPLPGAGARRRSGFRNGAASIVIEAAGAPDDDPEDLAQRQVLGIILLRGGAAR